MKVYVGNLLDGLIERLPLDLTLDFKTVEFNGDSFIFDDNTVIKGMITYSNPQLILNATATGSFSVNCARCMKECKTQFKFDISEVLSNSDNVSEDIIYFSGKEIDISEIAQNAFLSIAPIRVLCNENCLGLCPQCGTDLNIATCNCEDDDIDPRMSVLNNLLK